MSSDGHDPPNLALPGRIKHSMLTHKSDIRVSSRRQGKRP
jgi:hypothetical protein